MLRFNQHTFTSLALWPLAMVICLGSLVMPVTLVHAQEANPNTTFNEIFGPAWRKALGSTTTVDDVELATDLAKAVKTIDMPLSLMQVIVDKLTFLTEKAPGALLPAAQAMDKLESMQTDADAKAKCQVQTLAMLEKAMTHSDTAPNKSLAALMLMNRLVPIADQHVKDRKLDQAVDVYAKALKIARDQNDSSEKAIAAKFDKANSEYKQATEIDSLEKRIEANPADGEARTRLIFIHLVTRDDPSAAVWFAGQGVDEVTVKLLPIAAKEGANADSDTLMALADWYTGWADAAPLTARKAMLLRARTYYDRFTKLDKGDDLSKAKATLAASRIDKRIADLDAGVASAAASTPATPTTPTTPGTTPAGTRPTGLTIEIDGPTITEPDRVDRLYVQHQRMLSREYVKLGNDYAPITNFEGKFPSSLKETLASMKLKMTVVKVIQDGLIKRRVTIPPVPAEAEAVAMALPSFEVGAYGYLHSVEVAQIVGPDEMIVQNVWLVDPSSITGSERTERDKLRNRQDAWNNQGSTMRLFGYPTANLTVGERVGMIGRGKPMQIYIAKTETTQNLRNPVQPVAATISKLESGGLDDKEFEDLLAKRKLTRTDFVNIVLEAQRGPVKETITRSIARIEAKGAKLE